MTGFDVAFVGLLAAGVLAILACHPFSVRFVATWRLARFMTKMQLGAVPVVGYVAVNGNLENALVMSSRVDDVTTPGHIPLWLHEGAGEQFLAELAELRLEGTPKNPRLVRVVAFELLSVEETEEG